VVENYPPPQEGRRKTIKYKARYLIGHPPFSPFRGVELGESLPPFFSMPTSTIGGGKDIPEGRMSQFKSQYFKEQMGLKSYYIF